MAYGQNACSCDALKYVFMKDTRLHRVNSCHHGTCAKVLPLKLGHVCNTSSHLSPNLHTEWW